MLLVFVGLGVAKSRRVMLLAFLSTGCQERLQCVSRCSVSLAFSSATCLVRASMVSQSRCLARRPSMVAATQSTSAPHEDVLFGHGCARTATTHTRHRKSAFCSCSPKKSPFPLPQFQEKAPRAIKTKQSPRGSQSCFFFFFFFFRPYFRLRPVSGQISGKKTREAQFSFFRGFWAGSTLLHVVDPAPEKNENIHARMHTHAHAHARKHTHMHAHRHMHAAQPLASQNATLTHVHRHKCQP